MKRLRSPEFVLILVFLITIASAPIVQSVLEARRGEWPQALELLPLQLGDRLPARKRLGHRLAMHLRKLRLIVKCLDVRRTTSLIQEDYAFGFGRMMQRIHDATPAPVSPSDCTFNSAGLREQLRSEQRV